MNTKHTIINGDSRQMSELRDKSVHLVVTQNLESLISQNHLMAYLYLENKTFINAHLLKERLAEVNESEEFKYKRKFKTL
jgi:site-specific DNA-methyltransferase (adenine-specific)